MWAILALTTALLASFTPIIHKRILADADVPVVAWAAQAVSLPLLGLATIVLFRPLPQVDALFYVGVLGSAVLNAAAHLALTAALKLSDISLVTPFLAFSPVFTLAISTVALGERPTLPGVAGVLIIVAGAYLVNLKPGQTWVEPLCAMVRERGILLALLAALIWGLTPAFEKTAILHTSPENPPLVALAAALGLAVLLFPIAVRRPARAVRQVQQHSRGFLLLGIIGGVAPLMGYTAFSLGTLGYVTALFKLSVVLTILWSYLLLREYEARGRLPGVVVMLLGALLVTGQ